MKGWLKVIITVRCAVASPRFSSALATRPIAQLCAMKSAWARLAALEPRQRSLHGSAALSMTSTTAGAASKAAALAAAFNFFSAAFFCNEAKAEAIVWKRSWSLSCSQYRAQGHDTSFLRRFVISPVATPSVWSRRIRLEMLLLQ